MWIFQLKFIPIVYKELIIHRIKKEFNHKELLVLLVMVQQETACRYPALLVIFLLIFNFHTIILVILAISKHSPKEKRPTK
jgi:hypothetical protein